MKIKHKVIPYKFDSEFDSDKARIEVIKKIRESRDKLSQDDAQGRELDQVLYSLTDPSKDRIVLHRYYSMIHDVLVFGDKVYKKHPEVEEREDEYSDSVMDLVTTDKSRIDTFFPKKDVELVHIYEFIS